MLNSTQIWVRRSRLHNSLGIECNLAQMKPCGRWMWSAGCGWSCGTEAQIVSASTTIRGSWFSGVGEPVMATSGLVDFPPISSAKHTVLTASGRG